MHYHIFENKDESYEQLIEQLQSINDPCDYSYMRDRIMILLTKGKSFQYNRPIQLQQIIAFYKAISNNPDEILSAILSLATGTGKTHTFSLMLYLLVAEPKDNPGLRDKLRQKKGFIIVPTLAILKKSLDDWNERMVSYATILNTEPVRAVSINDIIAQKYKPSLLSTKVILACQQGMARMVREESDGSKKKTFLTNWSKDCSLTAVYDEAHSSFRADPADFLIQNLHFKQLILSSATASYPCGAITSVKDEAAKVSKVVSLPHLPLPTAIQYKLLVPAVFSHVEMPVKKSADTKIRISHSSGDYEQDALQKLLHQPDYFRAITEVYAKGKNRYNHHWFGQTAMILVPGVALAKALCTHLNEAYVEFNWKDHPALKSDAITQFAMPYTSDSTPEERHVMLEAIRNNHSRIIVGVKAAAVGLDAPPISVVFNCTPSAVEGGILQSLGRGVRPCSGKTHQDYVQFNYLKTQKSVTDIDEITGALDTEANTLGVEDPTQLTQNDTPADYQPKERIAPYHMSYQPNSSLTEKCESLIKRSKAAGVDEEYTLSILDEMAIDIMKRFPDLGIKKTSSKKKTSAHASSSQDAGPAEETNRTIASVSNTLSHIEALLKKTSTSGAGKKTAKVTSYITMSEENLIHRLLQRMQVLQQNLGTEHIQAIPESPSIDDLITSLTALYANVLTQEEALKVRLTTQNEPAAFMADIKGNLIRLLQEPLTDDSIKVCFAEGVKFNIYQLESALLQTFSIDKLTEASVPCYARLLKEATLNHCSLLRSSWETNQSLIVKDHKLAAKLYVTLLIFKPEYCTSFLEAYSRPITLRGQKKSQNREVDSKTEMSLALVPDRTIKDLARFYYETSTNLFPDAIKKIHTSLQSISPSERFANKLYQLKHYMVCDHLFHWKDAITRKATSSVNYKTKTEYVAWLKKHSIPVQAITEQFRSGGLGTIIVLMSEPNLDFEKAAGYFKEVLESIPEQDFVMASPISSANDFLGRTGSDSSAPELYIRDAAYMSTISDPNIVVGLRVASIFRHIMITGFNSNYLLLQKFLEFWAQQQATSTHPIFKNSISISDNAHTLFVRSVATVNPLENPYFLKLAPDYHQYMKDGLPTPILLAVMLAHASADTLKPFIQQAPSLADYLKKPEDIIFPEGIQPVGTFGAHSRLNSPIDAFWVKPNTLGSTESETLKMLDNIYRVFQAISPGQHDKTVSPLHLCVNFPLSEALSRISLLIEAGCPTNIQCGKGKRDFFMLLLEKHSYSHLPIESLNPILPYLTKNLLDAWGWSIFHYIARYSYLVLPKYSKKMWDLESLKPLYSIESSRKAALVGSESKTPVEILMSNGEDMHETHFKKVTKPILKLFVNLGMHLGGDGKILDLYGLRHASSEKTRATLAQEGWTNESAIAEFEFMQITDLLAKQSQDPTNNTLVESTPQAELNHTLSADLDFLDTLPIAVTETEMLAENSMFSASLIGMKPNDPNDDNGLQPSVPISYGHSEKDFNARRRLSTNMHAEELTASTSISPKAVAIASDAESYDGLPMAFSDPKAKEARSEGSAPSRPERQVRPSDLSTAKHLSSGASILGSDHIEPVSQSEGKAKAKSAGAIAVNHDDDLEVVIVQKSPTSAHKDKLPQKQEDDHQSASIEVIDDSDSEIIDLTINNSKESSIIISENVDDGECVVIEPVVKNTKRKEAPSEGSASPSAKREKRHDSTAIADDSQSTPLVHSSMFASLNLLALAAASQKDVNITRVIGTL